MIDEPVPITKDELRRMIHGRNYEECMEAMMSEAIAILCISYDVLHCDTNKKRAVEGIDYRTRDLQRLVNQIRTTKEWITEQ